MIRVVIDTNILVSGIISPKSSPAKIIDFWRERKLTFVTSLKILAEVKRVLSYPRISQKYHLGPSETEEIIKGFSVFSEICSPKERVSVVKDDPADNKFLEAAICAGVQFIVSGDKHLLRLKEYRGIKIISARQFLEELEKEV